MTFVTLISSVSETERAKTVSELKNVKFSLIYYSVLSYLNFVIFASRYLNFKIISSNLFPVVTLHSFAYCGFVICSYIWFELHVWLLVNKIPCQLIH
jgi:hypothetical protein